MRRTLALVALLALMTLPACVPSPSTPRVAPPGAGEPVDLLIRGGRLLDGTGTPWRRADVAVTGDRIVAVGHLRGLEAARTLDATGRYVAPGFIDPHSHAAEGLARDELSDARPLLAQGVTTVIVNPDGGGPVDLVAQREALLEDGLGVNVALLIGHGSVRDSVIGMEDRPPTDDELGRMRALVRQGMEAGAFGLSSGLFYAPGSYAGTAEVVALAREAALFGGVYTSHVRDEADYTVGVVGAVDEVIRVAEEAGLPGVITHVKVLGPRVWGLSDTVVRHVERARDRGVEVWADQYPYAASSVKLGSALLPRWAQEGGDDALARRLSESADRQRIEAAVAENLERRGGAGRLLIRRHEPDPSLEGRTLEEIARAWSVDPVEATLRIERAGGASVVSFNMTDDDVARFMRQPWTMTSSDGGLTAPGEGIPHPRSYGTFPRKLRKYALEEGVLDLGEAVRSMTWLPATVFRIPDRGIVRPGARADLVVFDPDRLDDSADFEEPRRLAEGIETVLVNGHVTVMDGRFTGEKAGRVLERRSRTPPGRIRTPGLRGR